MRRKREQLVSIGRAGRLTLLVEEENHWVILIRESTSFVDVYVEEGMSRDEDPWLATNRTATDSEQSIPRS
jgi:hypothetical protein